MASLGHNELNLYTMNWLDSKSVLAFFSFRVDKMLGEYIKMPSHQHRNSHKVKMVPWLSYHSNAHPYALKDGLYIEELPELFIQKDNKNISCNA